MLGEKKIETTLFGESVTLDFGLRFSGRLRLLYPDWDDISESGDTAKMFAAIVRAALPERLQDKSEDEIIDELDQLEGAEYLLNRCMKGFNAAMGFLAVALKQAIDAAEAVQKSGKGKK